MKQIILLLCTFTIIHSFAQNFTADMTTAKSINSSGKLEDAHFALLQAMQKINIIIGKQILSLLPQKMDAFAANTNEDNVTFNVGFVGTTIHCTYGQNDNADLTIIGNSPLVATLNTFLSTPLIGGMMSNGNNKIVKMQGYRGQLQRTDNGNGQTDYTPQIPLGN